MAPCCVSTSSLAFTNWFGKERVVLVGKYSLQLHGAGGGIDLVVQRQQRTGRDLFLLASRSKASTVQRVSLAQLLLDLRQ